MKVNLYEVERDDSETFVACCELAECFPDDPEDCANVAAILDREGWAIYGGGAAPLFAFKVVR